MEPRFYEEYRGILRLRVPFEDLYTSVFLLPRAEGLLLVDCATTAKDVETQILPALAAAGYGPEDLSAVLLTHRHGDHAGGLSRLLEAAPALRVITGAAPLFGGLSVYPLPGHTADCIGVLDEAAGVLLSGDGLQGAGVGRYRCSLREREAYFQTLNRLRADERIRSVLFSHAYEPWYRDRADGREQVLKSLNDCEACAREAAAQG